MPLRANLCRGFHRTLFGGVLETVTLLKRDDNQRQGTVTSYLVFQCRKSLIVKTGETLQGDMTSDHRTTWHLPKSELDRVGINHLNPLDRIVDSDGDYWQPESTTQITEKLWKQQITIDCLKVDPPT